MNLEALRAAVREIPDYPKPGILFRDITPLLRDGSAFATAIDRLFALAQPLAPQAVVGIESRGFVFGAPLALRLGVGFVPVRKPGKLPAERLTETYSLEYGEGQLEMHADAFSTPGRVLIVDDVLATGGTAAASARLVERAGGTVAGLLFLIELAALGGRSQLTGRRVESLLLY